MVYTDTTIPYCGYCVGMNKFIEYITIAIVLGIVVIGSALCVYGVTTIAIV